MATPLTVKNLSESVRDAVDEEFFNLSWEKLEPLWYVYAAYNEDTMDYTVTEIVRVSSLRGGELLLRGRYPHELVRVRAIDELGAYQAAMAKLKEMYK